MATSNYCSVQSFSCTYLAEISDQTGPAQVIGIDEGQFFPDICTFAENMANAGKVVIIAALDGTFQRQPFNRILDLVPIAESVEKLTAICHVCGSTAAYSKRLNDSMEIELIGGPESYIANMPQTRTVDGWTTPTIDRRSVPSRPIALKRMMAHGNSFISMTQFQQAKAGTAEMKANLKECSGGFGSVVEMVENSTQKHYAGKMMQCVTPKDRERIEREVNRLRKFAHPGIVGLKELASMGNMKVIVMDLGEQSLADIVKDHSSRGVLVAREVVYRVMVDVSSALNLMHNHKSGATAHGDVKMENILLFGGGHFKLCDLGAAEKEDVSSTRGVMSQLYVSPERMESETGRATCSSDVWALGIVLHWLLFGEPPFKSQNAARLIREIGSFRVSEIGSDCGGEERALLMRMLDPNPETRVTSSQLCSFGVFRCILNTPSALWRLKDADDKEHLDKEEMWKKELNSLKEKLAKSESEKNARKLDQEKIVRLERELAELRSNQTQTPLQPAPHSSGVRSNGPLASSAARQGTVIRSQIGAAAIELFDQTMWTVSENVFTKIHFFQYDSLISFEFGADVARLSLTIRKGPNNYFAVGIISSNLSNEVLTDYFPNLKGGAGWELSPNRRWTKQNMKFTNDGSACLRGRAGQRVVLEADGREGKRTLKLSQDGETQPVFFTNIPVPFRFAVCIFDETDAVEIESVSVVSSPQMVGGTIDVAMDE
ncbi:putative Thymidine kinase 1 [Blattamonas nauphoetae]|uniref:thymidine kinase n=1 Tax=Blattamonas nauphoetae TaxID=2049346 RepID=A0ABQ9XLR2_9EUKA|nr:putative Thymidine kinase 1 [Blattamonas nauphoetae]